MISRHRYRKQTTYERTTPKALRQTSVKANNQNDFKGELSRGGSSNKKTSCRPSWG